MGSREAKAHAESKDPYGLHVRLQDVWGIYAGEKAFRERTVRDW